MGARPHGNGFPGFRRGSPLPAHLLAAHGQGDEGSGAAAGGGGEVCWTLPPGHCCSYKQGENEQHDVAGCQ